MITLLVTAMFMVSCGNSSEIIKDKGENSATMTNETNNIQEQLKSINEKLTIQWFPAMYEKGNNKEVFERNKNTIQIMFVSVYRYLNIIEFFEEDQVKIIVSRIEYKTEGMEVTFFVVNNTSDTIKLGESLIGVVKGDTEEKLISTVFDGKEMDSIPPRTAYGLIIGLEEMASYEEGTVFIIEELITGSDVKYDVIE